MNLLTLATPAKCQVHAKYMTCIIDALSKFNAESSKKKINMGVTVQTLQGKSNITHARSIMLTEWYDKSKDGDLFLFIDSDQTFAVKDIIKSIELMKTADVVGGIYSNLAGKPTVFPINPKEFYIGHKDNRVYYVATGFMMISRPICTKIIPLIKNFDNVGRVTIGQNPNEKAVIHFSNSGLSKVN